MHMHRHKCSSNSSVQVDMRGKVSKQDARSMGTSARAVVQLQGRAVDLLMSMCTGPTRTETDGHGMLAVTHKLCYETRLPRTLVRFFRCKGCS